MGKLSFNGKVLWSLRKLRYLLCNKVDYRSTEPLVDNTKEKSLKYHQKILV